MWLRLGWPSNRTPYISQHSRSCQSAPAYVGTHDATAGSASSTSTLNVTPQCFAVDCTCANTWNRPADPAVPNVISWGCTGDDVSPPASSPSLGAGAQSIAEMNDR